MTRTLVGIATVEAPAINHGTITASVMLAAVMTVLDSTIANVALPHMAGSMSASADQITWVLMSYILAPAVMSPVTGWLARRIGGKRVCVITIAGFTLASALCGATQFVQGIGSGLVFTPMTKLAFATLSPALRADAAGMFALVRNPGNSAEISIMQTVFTRTTQVVHSRLAEGLTLDNSSARTPVRGPPLSLSNPTGLGPERQDSPSGCYGRLHRRVPPDVPRHAVADPRGPNDAQARLPGGEQRGGGR